MNATEQAIHNCKVLLRDDPKAKAPVGAVLVAYEALELANSQLREAVARIKELESEVADLLCHNQLMRDSLRKDALTLRAISDSI